MIRKLLPLLLALFSLAGPAAAKPSMSAPFYFVDTQNVAIRKVDASGQITNLALNSTDEVFTNNDGFADPWSLTQDSSGNLYVVDTDAHCIYRVNPSTGEVVRIVGNGLLGTAGDGGPALSARMEHPYYIILDPDGNLYVSEVGSSTGVVRVVNMGATTRAFLGVSVGAGCIGTVVSSFALDQGFSGDNGPAIEAEVSQIYGIALDAAGNLYFADQQNERIRKVDTSGIVTTVVGAGTPTIDAYGGDGGPAADALLAAPLGLTFDGAGNLFISDTYNRRIRAVNLQATTQAIMGVSIAAGNIDTVAGNGTQGFSGDDGPATVAEINRAWSQAFDAAGNLYICDTFNYRIRKVDAVSHIISTVVGTGSSGHSGDDGPATSAQIGQVFALSFLPAIEECCAIADPPNGPFDDFTELDPNLFLPCSTLRASTVAAINKNILEATLTPEFFPAAIFRQGDTVPLPISPVDGYAYSRAELIYLWSWNNTGPESDIRLPLFGAHIDSLTGLVSTDVWRLPPGTFPRHTADGSLRVIVIGSRQAQHPELVAPSDNPPGTTPPADAVSGSKSFLGQNAALPPTVGKD